jgi:P-type Cu+ transporter
MLSSLTTTESREVIAACFHCGEPCPDAALELEGKNFCCLGCQTVFSLLRENGLEQFYQLQNAPGTRMRQLAAVCKWAFLDDPGVAEQLLDYADERRAKVTLHLPAIHCVACVWLLENLFKLHPGVGQVVVNFARREAAISFTPSQIKFGELAALLASIGYEPQFTLGETEKIKPAPLSKKTWLQIGLAAFGFGNIMLLALPVYLGLDSFNGPWFKSLASWLSLAMALPVVTFSAADFWRTAWSSMKERTLTMEVPIAIGLAAIYLSSVWEVWQQRGPGYCDSLCGLIFFLLLGRLFQRKTHDRLTFDRDYKGFFPLSVMRKTASGEESVAISRLQVGDKIILRNGELLPADAKLVSDEACLDYSFVTGESEPVVRSAGAHLYAGGRQIGGVIEVETVKPVAQSYLASLWNNEAFRKKRDTDINSLTNRYSQRFTRLVIGIALGAAAFWLFKDAGKSLKAFTSVLIVACPCALALAAPLTHGTAQRVLARMKIFLKNALVIERLAEVDTIVLDKTGTLTTADARGVKFLGVGKTGELGADEKAWIASLARHSTHPNSIRVAKALAVEPLPVKHFQELAGCGVLGEVCRRKLLLGSRQWILSLVGGDVSAATGSGVFVAIDGQWRGQFALENSLRPEVEKLIAQLGGKYQLALLSGDNAREAERFQKIFGAQATLRFNQSPADKLTFIRELQQRGKKVMMVGDGLNDAGALKQAEVGVAVVEQAGVFSPASDVILDAAQLPQLARVLCFSRNAARTVRAGFIISTGYNLIGVSIAAAGLLAPIVCAVLMPISSATVVVFACVATMWLAQRAGLLAKDHSPLEAV